MSASRRLARNQIRRKYGNNAIQHIWHQFQVKKYGAKLLYNMYKRRGKRGVITVSGERQDVGYGFL